MSVVNVFVSSLRVAMLTDESLYSADATIVGFEQKAFPVESWNGAISGRGDMWGVATARDLAERYASFDEFVARSAPEIERLHRQSLATAGDGQTLIEIHAIGWSEREDRARAYFLRSSSPDADGGPFYVWRDHAAEDDCFYNELNLLEFWRLHRQGAEPSIDFTADTFDPVRHGLPLLEAQRRLAGDARYGADIGGRHLVGGAAWLTIVDRDGTRQGILHEWPDAIGEPIQPAPFDDEKHPKIAPSFATNWTYDRLVHAIKEGGVHPHTLAVDAKRMAEIDAAPPAANLNRAQRRALKHQAKKGRAHAA